MRLTTSVQQLAERDQEILIVGTGPAGVAAVERCYSRPGAQITIVERGPIGLTRHFNDLLGNPNRRKFINANARTPWLGAMVSGMLVINLGGRGTVAGANRPRFYQEDFSCFTGGEWPQEVVDALPALFSQAELSQMVRSGDISCAAQEWAANKLCAFHPAPPRISVDKPSSGFGPSRGYDSSAERLIKLAVLDSMSGTAPRLRIVTDCYVTRILHDRERATGVMFFDTTQPGSAPMKVAVNEVLLGLSPIESARLVLNSGLAHERPAAGRYLAEHVERRSKIRVRIPSGIEHHEGISLVIPPYGKLPNQRFQIHLRGEPDPEDNRWAIVEIGGFAAMDPQPSNQVTLSTATDEFGVPKAETHLNMSLADHDRALSMCQRIQEIIAKLDGEYITQRFPLEGGAPQYTDETRRVQVMDPGRSYHEAGTLRMGRTEDTSACNTAGKLHGMENVHVVDASLFPCVGVANPILTLSALAYWVSDRVFLDSERTEICA